MPPNARIIVNRAPVLTLWASVVAECLGYEHATALTLGKAVAGLTAQGKGRTLGIFKAPVTADGAPPAKSGLGEEAWVELLGRPVPVRHMPEGMRAVVKDDPIDPGQVQIYLAKAFGDAFGEADAAMRALATSYDAAALEASAYALYVRFRPEIPHGKQGWGAKGELDLGKLRELAR